MIEPARYDITIYKGVTFELPCTWKDNAGTIYELSHYTAHMQIRTSVDSPVTLCNLTSANGGITLGTVSPNIIIRIDAIVTATFPSTKAEYDLLLTDSNGTVEMIMKGKATINPTVTR